jgi:cell division protein FtsQ
MTDEAMPSRNVRRKKGAGPPPRPIGVADVAGVRGESRAMRILRGLLGFLMVVGIGGSAAWGARRYVKTSPRFAVREIVTIGAKRRSAEDLAITAGIAKGQNVFTTDLDRARARLLADPWIRQASLARQLPGTIFVQVEEREAAGLVAASGETYLATREGQIIKRLEPGDPTDLHVVTGVSAQQIVDDREGTTRTIRRALDLAFDYDRSPLGQRAPLEEVHVEETNDMTLVIGKSAVVLRMGAAPYRKKLEQAVRVFGELDRRGAKPDVIMLDDDARPERVVVRMR